MNADDGPDYRQAQEQQEQQEQETADALRSYELKSESNQVKNENSSDVRNTGVPSLAKHETTMRRPDECPFS